MLLLEHYLDYLSEQVGKHNDTPDDKFDAKELAMGIDIEKEHTNDEETAKKIAKDHLSSCPNYYTYLKKMEEEHNCED